MSWILSFLFQGRHPRRKHQKRASRQQQLRQQASALGLLSLLALGLLVWLIWQALLWFQQHPLVVTALWISALVLLTLAICGFCYWTFRMPPPGLRWRHPRRADLARYYDQRGTLQDLQALNPLDFERYVGQLFALEGYHVDYTPRSGDGGVDLLLSRPGRKRRESCKHAALVQCKRYASAHSVGSPELQQFSGAMRRAFAYEGYFVTTSFFTPAAQDWARSEGIHLIDGLALLQWRTRLERRARLGLVAPVEGTALGLPTPALADPSQEECRSGTGAFPIIR
jgi:hypothetical protein